MAFGTGSAELDKQKTIGAATLINKKSVNAMFMAGWDELPMPLRKKMRNNRLLGADKLTKKTVSALAAFDKTSDTPVSHAILMVKSQKLHVVLLKKKSVTDQNLLGILTWGAGANNEKSKTAPETTDSSEQTATTTAPEISPKGELDDWVAEASPVSRDAVISAVRGLQDAAVLTRMMSIIKSEHKKLSGARAIHGACEIQLARLQGEYAAELEHVAKTVEFAAMQKEAKEALKPLAGMLKSLQESDDGKAKLATLTNIIINCALALEEQMASIFTQATRHDATFGFEPSQRSRNLGALKGSLKKTIGKGRADIGRLYSSWLWRSDLIQPYDLQANGGFPMSQDFADKFASFDGDIQAMQADTVFRHLVPDGDPAQAVSFGTLQEVSETSVLAVIGAARALGLEYAYRYNEANFTAILTLKSRQDNPISSDIPPAQDTAPAALEALIEEFAGCRMLAAEGPDKIAITAHFQAISDVDGAKRNIDIYLDLISRMKSLASETGKTLIFNADANLPVTGTVKGPDGEVDLGFAATLAGIGGVKFNYSDSAPKKRVQSMVDNQQAVSKGGIGVDRSTMIAAFIPGPGVDLPKGDDRASASALMGGDNTTDHQIISGPDSVTLNCGYTGKGLGKDDIKAKLSRRQILIDAGLLSRLEKVMQASVGVMTQQLKANMG
ncbi:MAG: hypothetical protein ACI8RZ_003995 [Myxococcota bacterium]|jgi:hypothetical protein